MIQDVDRREIRSLAERFVRAWQSGKTEALDDLMTEDCEIDFSIFDKGISHEDFKRELATRTRKTTYTRFELFNCVCRVAGDRAQQSATICGVFADEDTEPTASLGFTAKMANALVKTVDGWRYSALRLELAGTSDNHARLYTTGVGLAYLNGGDTGFIANWHPIPTQVGWHDGTRILSVVPEVDAPWYAVPERTDAPSDEELINEVLYRYCFALDFDCLDIYYGVFTEDAMLAYGEGRIYDKRGVTKMLRFEREGGIGSHHVLYVDHVDIDGNQAYAKIYRSGADFVPSAWLYSHEGLRTNNLIGRYDMRFQKVGLEWRIQFLHYYQGGFAGPALPEEVYVCVSDEEE